MTNEKIAEKIQFAFEAVSKANFEITKARFTLLHLQEALPLPKRKLERKARHNLQKG